MKNTGSDTPAVVTMRQRWSIQVPCFTAASTPKGMAMPTARIRANRVSSAEAGRRVAISVTTGWPVLSELPRLPCARSTM